MKYKQIVSVCIVPQLKTTWCLTCCIHFLMDDSAVDRIFKGRFTSRCKGDCVFPIKVNPPSILLTSGHVHLDVLRTDWPPSPLIYPSHAFVDNATCDVTSGNPVTLTPGVGPGPWWWNAFHAARRRREQLQRYECLQDKHIIHIFSTTSAAKTDLNGNEH